MRRASVLAEQGQARRASIIAGQSNLAIHTGQGAPAPASVLSGARARRSTDAQRPEALLVLSREELARFEDDPHALVDAVSTFTAAEEASMKPVVKEAASASSMIGAHMRAGAIGWMSSFWVQGMVDESLRFADPYVVPYGIPEGALSAVVGPVVGASLAVLVSGSIAGGIRMSHGARPTPDDANLANLATLRAQKWRAFISRSDEYRTVVDEAIVKHLDLMTERDKTFGPLLRHLGAVGRSRLTDDDTYFPWHVLLSIGAITAPHLIDSHFGPDLTDRLIAAGLRVLYRVPFGVGSSDSTSLLQHFSRPWIQKTDGDSAAGRPTAPRKGIHTDEGIAAHLAAFQKREELLSIQVAKLDELRLRTVAKILRGETTKELAEPILGHIETRRRNRMKATLRVQYKMLNMRSTSGRRWLLIQNLASTLYKGNTKALPAHLKGVLTESALKIRTVANLLGCCTTLTAGSLFAYLNVAQLGPRPDPHLEGINGAEVALVVTNTVVLMELWKLRSPVSRYIFERALNVGVGMAEGTAKAVSAAVNWCCVKQRESLATRSARMQTEQIDLEAPAEQPAPGEPLDPTMEMLHEFMGAASMLLDSDDEGEGEGQTEHARFSEFLNQFAAKAKRSGTEGVLKPAFDSLPAEALEMIVECEFLNAGHSGELAQLAREGLLDRVDARDGAHEVKRAASEAPDEMSQDEREQIKAFLFDNAMMRNLWPAVHAGDPEAIRRAYTESKFGVLNLLQRIDPAHAKQEHAEAKVLELLEAFWSSLGQEFPQLVETLFDSLPRDELAAIMQRSELLALPAQQSLDGRVMARNDAAARAFDRRVDGHLRSAAGDPQARYQSAIIDIHRQVPRVPDGEVRRMLMDSIADLLANRAMSNVEVRALFDGLPNSELDAIRTYRTAPGTQATWQQGNVMRITRECLARHTGAHAAATADEFVGWLNAASPADYPAGYQNQLNLTGMQLQVAELPDTPESRREWLMDSIALALTTERIDEDKLVALLRSLPSDERAAIVARAAGVHAPDMAYRITLCARRAATQRREALGETAVAAFQSAFGATTDEMPSKAAIAATAYEAYWRAVLPGAIESPSDNALNEARVALVAHLGRAAATDPRKPENQAIRRAHDTLTILPQLTRPPT